MAMVGEEDDGASVELREQRAALRAKVPGSFYPSQPALLIGTDPRLLEVWKLVMKVAATEATVLITGETGTGKELIAHTLHEESLRRQAPFMAVNCGAVAETLQESELFGHVKGAFTGATTRKLGKFEAAEGGTIFLDEISEMSKTLQVKLLRILQFGEYSPVGMAEPRYCNVRVIAATNQNLRPLIAAGAFRKDLYYRLNIIRLELPPLRERSGDLPLLIKHFLQQFGAAYNKPALAMSPEAQEILLQYDYPGNVRELENMMHRAVILCEDTIIHPYDLPPEVFPSRCSPAALPCGNFHEVKARMIATFEKSYLTAVLRECGGIVSRAAQRSGLSERNFHEKLKLYGLSGRHGHDDLISSS